HGTGWGDISWNGAISASPKPILVQLPSYGAPPSVGSCPMDNRFIVCSAFNNSSGTTNGQSDYTIAILAIQQMIKNIMASGKSTQDVFVIGKSQGGGTGMITAGLCPFVKDCFFSVPALAGFTGSSGVNGGFPGWPSDTISSYLDAVNHAKRYRNKISFSISYNDVVTWGRGQVTCAKNTQYETTIYHGNDGHGDNDWWTNGTTWLNGCLDNIVDNGLGLADSSVVVEQIEVNSNPKFRLFPNPVEQGSIIMFERPFTGKLNIYDSKGSMIAETKIVNRTQLLLFELVDETLPRGHFVLNLIDSKSSVSVPIIVK
ncbi:MAG: hypothetical protein MRY83_20555, partial [Flavobacteriales bacterium]|nr:hypothetical protein [Flavobacteriales bacterium]